jgi:hypothetical protein
MKRKCRYKTCFKAVETGDIWGALAPLSVLGQQKMHLNMVKISGKKLGIYHV